MQDLRHDPNASSRAQGLEGKEISAPSGQGRKMSLTCPLIDQALALRIPGSPDQAEVDTSSEIKRKSIHK
jgi:hypothetical protein